MTAYPATGRQLDALRFIVGYQDAHDGISPTTEEIGAAIGLTSRSGASRLLTCLEERGRIRRLPNRARAIEVLVGVPVPRAPDGAPLYAVPLPFDLAERIPAHD